MTRYYCYYYYYYYYYYYVEMTWWMNSKYYSDKKTSRSTMIDKYPLSLGFISIHAPGLTSSEIVLSPLV